MDEEPSAGAMALWAGIGLGASAWVALLALVAWLARSLG
jgi:hypothetical protein